MRLFGVNVDSLLTPETKYLVTSTSLITSLDEEMPSIYSLDDCGRIVREMILLKESKLPGRRIQPGYRIRVEVRTDGRLNSFRGAGPLLLDLKERRRGSWLSADLLLEAGIARPEIILIIKDVPILAEDEGELRSQILDFLKEWGIVVNRFPTVLHYVPQVRKVKAKIVDIDYFPLAFPSKLPSDLA